VAPRIQRLSGFASPLTEEAALLERAGVRIVGRAVKVMAGEFSIRIPFKRGRGIERRRDCAGGRVHMSSGMNADGLKLLILNIALPKGAAVPPPSRRKYPDPVQPTDGQVQTF
jgi:hypothetical protein